MRPFTVRDTFETEGNPAAGDCAAAANGAAVIATDAAVPTNILRLDMSKKLDLCMTCSDHFLCNFQ
jgi:hypothetical protein